DAWNIIKHFGLTLQTEPKTRCVVADGTSCTCLGTIDIPIQLEHQTRIISALVVPSFPGEFILGVDFWLSMNIVPDLNQGTWCRVKSSEITCDDRRAIENITENQNIALNRLVERFSNLIGNKIGCTNL
ncbi:hypothetical protein CBL_20282, partial [Carabus blaptoides fortunei]